MDVLCSRLLYWSLLRVPLVRLNPAGILLPLRSTTASDICEQEAVQADNRLPPLILGVFQYGKYAVFFGLCIAFLLRNSNFGVILSSPGPKPLSPKPKNPKTQKPKTKGPWADTKIL